MGMQTSNLKVFSGTGTAHANYTLSTDSTHRLRILLVTCAYSNTPTQAGVTSTLNSALGSGFDCTLNTGSANARYTAWIPANEIILERGDTLDVLAPDGGVGLTASIAIYAESAL